MKIKNIHIQNYKGFEDCKVDFHPRMNVFIGSNASGKTTLLEAILKSVYSITKEFAKSESSFNLNLENEEINYQAVYSRIETEIDAFVEYDLTAFGIVSSSSSIPLKNVLDKNEKHLKFINWLGNQIHKSSFTIPIFKYYPANRDVIEYKENKLYSIVYPISQLETWANIYQDSVSYSKFHKWFLENETNELLLQRDSKDFSIQSPVLFDVRTALSKALEMIGYKNITLKTKQIKREGNSNLIPIIVLEDNITMKDENLDNKSDGEKTIITLIADIAYNLSIAKDFQSGDNFLDSPGVVMIDEVETHLHPNWQRKIIPILTEIFPNIQFFIATHSPQVISSVKSESVFLLDKFTVRSIHLKTLGEDSNSLLKTIFDATDRPEEFIQLIEKFDYLMDEEAEEKELQEIIDLIKELYNKDESTGISNLIDELNIQLSAYLFDKDYEENNKE